MQNIRKFDPRHHSFEQMRNSAYEFNNRETLAEVGKIIESGSTVKKTFEKRLTKDVEQAMEEARKTNNISQDEWRQIKRFTNQLKQAKPIEVNHDKTIPQDLQNMIQKRLKYYGLENVSTQRLPYQELEEAAKFEFYDSNGKSTLKRSYLGISPLTIALYKMGLCNTPKLIDCECIRLKYGDSIITSIMTKKNLDKTLTTEIHHAFQNRAQQFPALESIEQAKKFVTVTRSMTIFALSYGPLPLGLHLATGPAFPLLFGLSFSAAYAGKMYFTDSSTDPSLFSQHKSARKILACLQAEKYLQEKKKKSKTA